MNAYPTITKFDKIISPEKSQVNAKIPRFVIYTSNMEITPGTILIKHTLSDRITKSTYAVKDKEDANKLIKLILKKEKNE